MGVELEKVLVTEYKEGMISFINSDPQNFIDALELALSDKPPFNWRSAWLLNNVISENDIRIKKNISKILKAAKEKSGGHQRELIKILFKMDLTETQEGKLFDLCVTIWEDISHTPSERMIAIKVIVKLVKKYPELKNEISFLFDDHYLETLSPGVKHSVNKMKQKL